MKFKEADLITIDGKEYTVFGVSSPWGNTEEPEAYMIGEGDKFLPGFTGTWVPIEELDTIAELVV